MPQLQSGTLQLNPVMARMMADQQAQQAQQARQAFVAGQQTGLASPAALQQFLSR
jgi:hypothetical protein